MRAYGLFGVIAVGLGTVAPGPALAQSGPVAVPIVGSPAAQQGAQLPAQPPPAPSPAQSLTTPSQPSSQAERSGANVPSERKLQLAFQDGTVSLVAQNVTVRDILAEWQRRGGCQFVNADKLPGASAPVSMQFVEGTPEGQAIDSLLRGAAGYVVAPRSDRTPGGSSCGAVYILATSHPTASATYSPTASPVAAPLMIQGSPDDEIPPVMQMPAGPQRLSPNQPANPNQPQPQPANQPPATGSGLGFGPVAPTAPGAGRIGGPPATPMPPNGPGRGGL